MGAAYDRAHILYNLHRYAQALKEFEQELAIAPDSPSAHAMVSLCQMNLGNYQSARISAERAIQVAPEYDWGYYALACALYYDSKFTTARVGEIPDQILKGTAAQYRLKPAAAALREALRLSPLKYPLYDLLSAIAFDDLDPHTALNTANLGLAINPTSQGCLRMRSLVLRYFGDISGAHAASEQALAIDPLSSANHLTAGWTAFFAGKYAGARMHFAEALRTSPTSKPAQQALLWAMRSRYFFFRPVIWVCRIGLKFRPMILRLRSLFKGMWPVVVLLFVVTAAFSFVPLILCYVLVLQMLFADYLLLFDSIGCLLLTRSQRITAVYFCSFTIFMILVYLFVLDIRIGWGNDWHVQFAIVLAGPLLPPLLTLLRPRRLRISPSAE